MKDEMSLPDFPTASAPNTNTLSVVELPCLIRMLYRDYLLVDRLLKNSCLPYNFDG